MLLTAFLPASDSMALRIKTGHYMRRAYDGQTPSSTRRIRRPCPTTPHDGMAEPRSSTPIFARALLLSFLAAAVVVAAAFVAAPVAAADDQTVTTTAATCVPSLQRLLSCLDFIEHRTEKIPVPCCVQVRRTVAEQPCCLMHVMRGNTARLIGPEYDSARAMVNVTAECLGDASVLVDITRNCSGLFLLHRSVIN